MADKLAAQNGTYGMAIPVMDTTARYGSFTDPTAETAVTVEFELDPNSITMSNGEAFFVVRGDGAGYDFWLQLYYSTVSGYGIQAGYKDDAAASQYGSIQYITDTSYKIRLVWQASSGVGNDDGYYKLYIDDILKESVTDIDNDTRSVGFIEYGAITAIDAGTYGIFYMDDCKWTSTIFSDLQIETSAGNSIGTITDGDGAILLSSGEEWFIFDLGALVDIPVDSITEHGATGATETIDWSANDIHSCELDDDCTFTFTAPPTVDHLTLIMEGNGTAYTPVFPATVKWVTPVPTWSGTDGKKNIVSMVWDGTDYIASGGDAQ